MVKQVAQWLARVVGLALLSVLCGMIGRPLAEFPGYASPLWLPAGIAFLAVLLGGSRYLPGVFLGSLLINLQVTVEGKGFNETALVIGIPIGLGAMGQALLGAWLVRRVVNYPNPLTHSRDIAWFLLLGGPASCLVNATCGCLALRFLGIVPWDSLPGDWISWWVGDSLGVILTVLIVLPFLGSPSQVWQPRIRLVALPMLGLLLVTLVAFLLLRHHEHGQFKRHLLAIGEQAGSGVNQGVHQSEVAFRNWYQRLTSQSGTPKDLTRGADQLLAANETLNGLGIVALVAGADRRAYEQARRKQGQPDFQISDWPGDARKPAGQRGSYAVVEFWRGTRGEQLPIGLDLFGHPLTRERLRVAAEQDQFIALPLTEVLFKAHLTDEPNHLAEATLYFHPLYHPNQPRRTPEQRRQALRGFAVCLVDLSPALDRIQASLSEYRLTASWSILRPEHPLARVAFPGATVTSDQQGYEAVVPVKLASVGALGILALRAGPDYLAAHHSPHLWWVFLLGLSLTGLIGFHLLRLSGDTALVTNEVKRRLRELEQSRNLLRTLIKEAPAAVAMFDTQMRYLGYSRRWLIDYRLGEQDLTGRSHYEVFPEIPSRWKEIHQRCLSGATESCEDDSFPRADGLIDHVRWQVQPWYDDANRIGGLIMLTEVITERVRLREEQRKLDEMLQQSQHLESLGVLAGGIAHDFNNLLTTIMGYAGLSQTGLSPSSPIREYLGEIESASRQAAFLCEQMLAYAGKRRFVEDALDLSRLVRECEPLLRHIISSQTTLHLQPTPVPLIVADPAQMRHVVVNLVTNAAEALVDGAGTITVATRPEDVDAPTLGLMLLGAELPAGEYVCLEVSDTGCGMEESVKARIFEPFFSTKFTGRGLGLAAVLGIVRGHKGALQVDSIPGQGSTFRLLFPRAKITGEQPPGPSPLPSSKQTILVVDDEEDVRRMIVILLESMGFQTLQASDGAEALALIREQRESIVAVLLDMTMPRMDGLQTWAELQRLAPTVPVVLMSGYSEDEVRGQFAGAVPAAFVQKPFTRTDLTRILGQVISLPA